MQQGIPYVYLGHVSCWSLKLELVVETERHRGRDVVRVGRAPDNQIQIMAANVSRYHCSLVIDDLGDITLEDTSSYGTYLNLHRLRTASLFHRSDRIYFGRFVLLLAAAPWPLGARQPSLREDWGFTI